MWSTCRGCLCTFALLAFPAGFPLCFPVPCAPPWVISDLSTSCWTLLPLYFWSWALWAGLECLQSTGEVPRHFAKAPSVFLWIPPRTLSQLCADPLGWNCRFWEQFCVWEESMGWLWALRSSETTPRLSGAQRSRQGLSLAVTAQRPLCCLCQGCNIWRSFETSTALKPSWDCPVIAKVAWGWVTWQAGSSC